MRWLDDINDSVDVNLSELWELVTLAGLHATSAPAQSFPRLDKPGQRGCPLHQGRGINEGLSPKTGAVDTTALRLSISDAGGQI